MPPIWRGADKPIRVTRSMQWGTETVLWWFLEDGVNRDGWDEKQAVSVRKFVRSHRLTIDADTFSDVRNLLDLELINGGCDHDHTEGEVQCDFCLWCQALILRDWMDSLMDVAGCYRSPRVEAYVSHGDGDPTEDQARWDASDCGCHANCEPLAVAGPIVGSEYR